MRELTNVPDILAGKVGGGGKLTQKVLVLFKASKPFEFQGGSLADHNNRTPDPKKGRTWNTGFLGTVNLQTLVWTRLSPGVNELRLDFGNGRSDLWVNGN